LALALVCDAKNLFSVKVGEMLESDNLVSLKQALATDGAFSVTGLSGEYTQAIQVLAETAPSCFKEDTSLPEIRLADGSARTTFGTNSNSYPQCLDNSGDVVSSEFERTFRVVSSALESLTGSEKKLAWRNPEEEAGPQGFKDLLHKDHIHVYSRTNSSSSKAGQSLDFHVDSGILLMLTPATQLPLQIKSNDGSLIDTANVGDDAIIFIVARGLPSWLLSGTDDAANYFPAPHGVPSLSGKVDTRTVFARMMVASGAAVPVNPAADQIPFKNVFLQKSVKKNSELCPVEPRQKREEMDCS